MSRRGLASVLGCAVASVGAFVVLDHFGGGDRFADLPGGADLRLVGHFTPQQVVRLGALPEAAAVECDDALYDVGVTTARASLKRSTVLTALRSPGLQRTALVEGRNPVADAEILAVDGHGLLLGERVTLARGGHALAVTVVGVSARPAGRPDAVALLPAGGMARLGGGPACGELVVQLKRRSEATAFQRGAKGVLGSAPTVTYDESLRGHV
ncbi:hypothetical protein AB0M46_09470 [Dactylosporangium sp. NPDC051485]|uniref:hypothetical protein n=1 Tax=Dactylosporangium sp. NPDC051485 TaxID=3154846 RepID=UPI00343FCB51